MKINWWSAPPNSTCAGAVMPVKGAILITFAEVICVKGNCFDKVVEPAVWIRFSRWAGGMKTLLFTDSRLPVCPGQDKLRWPQLFSELGLYPWESASIFVKCSLSPYSRSYWEVVLVRHFCENFSFLKEWVGCGVKETGWVISFLRMSFPKICRKIKEKREWK